MIRRYILPLFRSLYFVLILLAAGLSACVWYFAPFIGSEDWRPFDSILSRGITIGVIWVVILMIIGLVFWRRRGRDRQMTEDMAEPTRLRRISYAVFCLKNKKL